MRREPNIALFGGTFDPIHYGHLIIAEQLRSIYNFDEIWFCPNYISPVKKKTFFSAEKRLYFTQLACKDNPFFKVLDFEIQRKGISYTIDTINEIYEKKKLKLKHLNLILSQDLFQHFETWKDYKSILEKVNIITFNRYQNNENRSTKQIVIFPISSSMIRSLIEQRKTTRYLVPQSIEPLLYL